MCFNNKKILILGATSETVKLVQRANEMGLETFVVDPYVDAPAKRYANHAIDIDCFDIEKLVNLVEKNKIDGILPGCADILIPIYFELCSRTGKYCYVNKEIVYTLNNKNGELIKCTIFNFFFCIFIYLC